MSNIEVTLNNPEGVHADLSNAVCVFAGWSKMISPDEAEMLAERLFEVAKEARELAPSKERAITLFVDGQFDLGYEVFKAISMNEQVLVLKQGLDRPTVYSHKLVTTLANTQSHVQGLIGIALANDYRSVALRLFEAVIKAGGHALAVQIISDLAQQHGAAFVIPLITHESEYSALPASVETPVDDEVDVIDDETSEDPVDEDDIFSNEELEAELEEEFLDDEFGEEEEAVDPAYEELLRAREGVAQDAFNRYREPLMADLPFPADPYDGWRHNGDSLMKEIRVPREDESGYSDVVRNAVVLFHPESIRTRQVVAVDVVDGQAGGIRIIA